MDRPPTAHLKVVKAQLVFLLPKALLDGPARIGHLHQPFQRNTRRRVGNEELPFAAPRIAGDDQPVGPGGQSVAPLRLDRRRIGPPVGLPEWQADDVLPRQTRRHQRCPVGFDQRALEVIHTDEPEARIDEFPQPALAGPQCRLRLALPCVHLRQHGGLAVQRPSDAAQQYGSADENAHDDDQQPGAAPAHRPLTAPPGIGHIATQEDSRCRPSSRAAACSPPAPSETRVRSVRSAVAAAHPVRSASVVRNPRPMPMGCPVLACGLEAEAGIPSANRTERPLRGIGPRCRARRVGPRRHDSAAHPDPPSERPA